MRKKPKPPSKTKLMTTEVLPNDAHAFEMAMVRARARWRAAELKAALEKLPVDRQEELKRKLEQERS